MENKIVTAIFKDSTHTKVSDVWQYDYGQILRIQGLDLPTAVEVDFAVAGASESIARIGTTKDGVTDVVIPDSLIETGKNLVAYIYLRDAESGNTEYQIDMLVTKRAKPEAYDRPEDKELFGQAIEAVNTAADRAEKAGKTAQEAATKTGQDAEQTAQDRVEVAKMVETVTDISEQVKKVEDLSNKAQAAATKTEADAQQTAEDRVEVGKILETVKDVSEQVKTVDESVRKAKESERAAEGHRTAVEEMKNSVEQTASTFPQTVQEGVQAVENAGTAEVHEITQAGAAQKTAVEGAGTQAVENVENVKASATEAVETAKTEAVQSVQTEGNTQTGNVTTEGTKQVKAVQDKGNEVLQSIPEDFQMQMESKLDKQQGVENKGKALVIGEDGNVAPGEVQSGGGDGIAIINTMSGENPLAIPDSAERVNKRLELGGKTEQVSTRGVNLWSKESKITFTATKQVVFDTPIPAGDYVVSANVTSNDKDGTVCLMLFYYTDSGSKGANLTRAGRASAKITFTSNVKHVVLYAGQNANGSANDTATFADIQLEKGSTATAYEPYTGGKPSPSPEYLQEIKNSGKWNEEKQKYEVDVKITGKNLFDMNKFIDTCNFTKNEDGTFIIDKHVERYDCFIPANTILSIEVLKVGDSSGAAVLELFYEDGKSMYIGFGQVGVKTFLIQKDVVYIKVLAYRKHEYKYIQLEKGNTATPYEPYKEQTLTLTSDRPITKWDRLVEQGGQYGWLYGGKIAKDFSVKLKSTDEEVGGKIRRRFKTTLTGKFSKSNNVKCNFASTDTTNSDYGIGMVGNGDVYLYFFADTKIETIEQANLLLASLSEKIIEFESESTEFIPLPQSEQNAIRALKTYYPTTVITADGGELDPDIKVTYTADTKNYIDNKVSAKVASIIRQYRLNTANLLSLMPMETQATMIENDTNNILENAEEMKHE